MMIGKYKYLYLSIVIVYSVISADSAGTHISVNGSATNASPERARSVSSVLDPLGMWKSASRMVRKGVHMFRESLHEGVKVAQMLKEDVHEGVALLTTKPKPSARDSGDSSSSAEEFVKKANDDLQLPREGVMGGILRFMGVDSSSIGIVVLNVLIFFAEMVTASMLGKDSNSIADARMMKANLFEWVTKGHNAKLDKLLEDAKDKGLPENIITTLQDKTGNSTACVQLLVCKMSPFIWGVQKTVESQLMSHGQNRTPSQDQEPDPRNSNSGFFGSVVWDQLFKLLPDKSGFVSFGNTCEQRFPNCKLLKFPKKTQA